MRSVPHCFSLATSITPPPINPLTRLAADGSTQPPIQRTGWSGDGAPNPGGLERFQLAAITQHYTKSLQRVAGTDFTLRERRSYHRRCDPLLHYGCVQEAHSRVDALTILRQDTGRTAPEQLLQLYGGSSALDVTRIDQNTLELQAEKGWGATTFERIFGRLDHMPRVGETLRLERLEVSVQESDREGHPKRVRFRFPSTLDASERKFYTWEGRAPVPWQPPAIGEHIQLAPLSLVGSLPR